MFWKKKEPPTPVSTETASLPQPNDGRFKPMGQYGCKEAILKVWEAIPVIFSSRYVARAARSLAKVEFLDSTVTRSMRELREQGKIKYVVKDRSLGAYQKLD